jgi:hypothetical protein
MTVTASAISGILKKAGFKRASTRGTSWSSGFAVKDFGGSVRVEYTAVNTDQAIQTLKQMADLINGRQDNKYFAAHVPGEYGHYLKVTAYDETDPEQNGTPRSPRPWPTTPGWCGRPGSSSRSATRR